MKLWEVAKRNDENIRRIQSEYNLPTIAAVLLDIRGITSKDEIEDFIYNDSELDSPFEIKDMDKAVRRIQSAVENCELICVYGDYDADGVTSTALMYSYLEASGSNVMYYIPSRLKEGYGMNISAVEALYERGVKLIVTVDNGIAANKEIDRANELGIDVVVTDHHMPQGELPNACAVVDLHREDCDSKFKSLCGAGVAFKVITALEGDYCDVNMLLDNYADLLCLGTVGDIVELRGENRVFVKRGIKSLMDTDRAGIEALIRNSGLGGRTLNSHNVSFGLVPRINSAGRLETPQRCVELLLTDDNERADEIASYLCEQNDDRKKLEREILDKIDIQLKNGEISLSDRVLVLDGENWHEGVIGLAAARVKEKFGKPVIVITREGDKAKGSGRSVEGFPLCDAVFACADLLKHYGGHPMAVGLSLESKNIGLFRKRINEYAKSFGKMPCEKLKIDCKLNPAALSVALVDSLDFLQPYGEGNPKPVFGLYNMTLKSVTPLSNGKHLRLMLARGEAAVNALDFFVTPEEFPYQTGETLDLAVTLEKNEYNGNISVTVIVEDIKPSGTDAEKELESLRNYESFCRGEDLNEAQLADLSPTREDFALLYRYLRSNAGFKFPIEILAFRLDNKLSFGKIKIIIDAMSSLGLIETETGLHGERVTLSQVEGKVCLEDAPVIKELRRRRNGE